MKSKYFKLLCITSLILIAGCGKKIDYEAKILNKQDVILAYGDSLTYGMGASLDQSYPSQLAKITGYNVINAGLNGDTASGSISRLETEIEDNNPKLILLGLGGNDMLRQQDKELEKDLIEMINFIKAKNIQVVLLATPKPNVMASLGASLNDAPIYFNVAKNTHTYLIEDIYSKYLSKQTYKSDLIHLNNKGYRLVAEDIAKNLKENKFIE